MAEGAVGIVAWRSPGYTAAEAAHMFEEFLELRMGRESFWDWLMHYPVHGIAPSADSLVEDEIDAAILSLLAFEHRTRTWERVRHELMDARARLSGLARI